MTTYTSAPTTVQAERWDGSDLSLRRIQQLIFPRSPYVGLPIGDLAEASWHERRMGVPVDVDSAASDYLHDDLKFIASGDWVVKWPSGRIAVMTAGEFAGQFGAAGAEANARMIDESLKDA